MSWEHLGWFCCSGVVLGSDLGIENVDIALVLIAILEMHVFSQRRLFYTLSDMFRRN